MFKKLFLARIKELTATSSEAEKLTNEVLLNTINEVKEQKAQLLLKYEQVFKLLNINFAILNIEKIKRNLKEQTDDKQLSIFDFDLMEIPKIEKNKYN